MLPCDGAQRGMDPLKALKERLLYASKKSRKLAKLKPLVHSTFDATVPAPGAVTAISSLIIRHLIHIDRGTLYDVPARLDAYLQTVPPTRSLPFYSRVMEGMGHMANVGDICKVLVERDGDTEPTSSPLWPHLLEQCAATIALRCVVPVVETWSVLSASLFGPHPLGPPLQHVFNSCSTHTASSAEIGEIGRASCRERV